MAPPATARSHRSGARSRSRRPAAAAHPCATSVAPGRTDRPGAIGLGCDGQAKMPPGSNPCAKYRTKASATIHIRGWISSSLPRATLISTHAMNAGADAVRDAERQGHQDERQERRQALLHVREVDVLDQRRHQVSDEDEHRAGGDERDERRERGDEDGEQEQDADHHGGQPGSPSLGHAGGALDVAGVRADARLLHRLRRRSSRRAAAARCRGPVRPHR